MAEPIDAYATAYDALAGTTAGEAPDVRQAIARQTVDALMKLRAEKGLGWLRNIGATAYFNHALEVARGFGEYRHPDAVVGRAALHEAYEATAAVIVAAYARKPKES